MTEEKKETKISPWPWEAGTLITDDHRVIQCIYDADRNRIATDFKQWIWGEANMNVMAAAPELREELEKLVKRSCSMCAAEMKAAITPQNKPCEDGRPCPYGLDGAKKAIEKSYGKGD